ncbi:hypothetical protein, partial [Pseudactinotalea sp.]|uniref:hypothetical protein n=1 Tax=Pseudactinotalea sp. TaxID=1926260 RepID=UPI003B3B97FB
RDGALHAATLIGVPVATIGNGDGTAESERRARKQARRELKAAFPTRLNIDAALRGQLPVSQQIADYINELDAELTSHGTFEPMVVKVPLMRSTLPDVLERGTRVYEPSYTEAYRTDDDRGFRGDVLVRLGVTDVVPAMIRTRLKDAELVLIGRGLEWEIDQLEQRDGVLAIAGHAIACRPQPVSADPA